MGYYSDITLAYEGQDTLLTLKQLIAGEGGNDTHEALFTYLMGHTFGPRYKDNRAGQAFLLLAPPLMRVLGAWDSYLSGKEYAIRMGLSIEPPPPLEVVYMLNGVDGVQLSPYMLSLLSRGIEDKDYHLLDADKVYQTPLWITYKDLAVSDDRSLCIEYITRELGYSTDASIAIHNLIIGNLYV
jgi:hypothetical protein